MRTPKRQRTPKRRATPIEVEQTESAFLKIAKQQADALTVYIFLNTRTIFL